MKLHVVWVTDGKAAREVLKRNRHDIAIYSLYGYMCLAVAKSHQALALLMEKLGNDATLALGNVPRAFINLTKDEVIKILEG